MELGFSFGISLTEVSNEDVSGNANSPRRLAWNKEKDYNCWVAVGVIQCFENNNENALASIVELLTEEVLARDNTIDTMNTALWLWSMIIIPSV